MERSSKRGLKFSLRAFASCCFLQLDMRLDIFLLEFFLDRYWKWLTTLTTSTVWLFYMLFPYLPLLWARRLHVPNFCLLSSMHQKTGKGFSLCLSHTPNSTKLEWMAEKLYFTGYPISNSTWLRCCSLLFL